MIPFPEDLKHLGGCPKVVTIRCPYCKDEFPAIVGESDICLICHRIYHWEMVDGQREAVFDD